jgi:hypothetical protein
MTMASSFVRRTAWLLAAAALLAVAPASAQPLDEGEKAAAKAFMTSAHAKYDAGDYAAALPDYQAADRIMGVPTTRAAVGRTQAKLGLLVEARATMASVAQIATRPDEPQAFTDARAEAKDAAASIAARIPTLVVVIEPAAAVASVDGRAVTSQHSAVSLNPGPHTVVAEAAGFRRYEELVELAEGDRRTLTLRLLPAGGVPAPLPPDEAAPVAEAPRKSNSTGPILMGVGFGVGGAGLILGAVAGGLASAATSDLKNRCTDDRCPRATTEDDYQSALSLAHASTAGFVIAGVGAAIGVVGIVVLLRAPDESAPMALRLGPSRVGVEVGF